MAKTQIEREMDDLMKEAKKSIKEMKGYITGLKKKDRETDEYKDRVNKAEALRVQALKMLDEYSAKSKERFGK